MNKETENSVMVKAELELTVAEFKRLVDALKQTKAELEFYLKFGNSIKTAFGNRVRKDEGPDELLSRAEKYITENLPAIREIEAVLEKLGVKW